MMRRLFTLALLSLGLAACGVETPAETPSETTINASDFATTKRASSVPPADCSVGGNNGDTLSWTCASGSCSEPARVCCLALTNRVNGLCGGGGLPRPVENQDGSPVDCGPGTDYPTTGNPCQ